MSEKAKNLEYTVATSGLVSTLTLNSSNLYGKERHEARGQFNKSIQTDMLLRVVEKRFADELSDLVDSEDLTKEKLMKYNPLKTDTDIEGYLNSRPEEEKDLDKPENALLKRRLIKMGLHNPSGVIVYNFRVLYSPEEDKLLESRRVSPTNKSAYGLSSDGRQSLKVVSLEIYQKLFNQALAKLEAEDKKNQDSKKRSVRPTMETQQPIAALAAPYKK